MAEGEDMDRFMELFFGSPKRLLGSGVALLVIFAIISPAGFNWLMVRVFNTLWPWGKVVGMLAAGWYVMGSIFRPAPKKGKKGD
ncbi:hypothetical protein A2333_03080 [Candidatus Wolfebacteria bacterium RIFOXYB2_FULL_49_7]|uniref:Uncharacterized protein n=1 Tax=Candidatus Wolfebacteria bacterium RIFOXYB1_FULL_54_12 TaxID=1802559 RepID=A0A1F8DXU9_9BACT|nr:MAG: hypothetical protein A2372_03570 [Candidatus Wolfebacteria bacterium RIFOXYB1_FULL_54_12]OGM93803.1 MAG: hypothetical protein A2333_03080 [Candidatus Wolfebacteria bacterium RIFOXYB2_FULL_49_7]